MPKMRPSARGVAQLSHLEHAGAVTELVAHEAPEAAGPGARRRRSAARAKQLAEPPNSPSTFFLVEASTLLNNVARNDRYWAGCGFFFPSRAFILRKRSAGPPRSSCSCLLAGLEHGGLKGCVTGVVERPQKGSGTTVLYDLITPSHAFC